MTECAPLISYSDKCEHVFRSSGKAISNMEIAIRSGQIFVKGENLMLGYYKDEENTNKSFVDGWFKTGDLGYFDDDYNLYVTGRKDIIIKSDGKNINPLEIEEIINSQNGIDDSIVFFDKIENKLKAIIHLANNDLDIEEIKESINAKLSANEYVSDFIIHAEPFEKTLKGETKRYLYLK
jgi:long-chain acyl-CoA synthetase